mmetsp:Transcript_21211/g.35733  ORF Transcript_21211/g.35733 Transcript_21211/m.35733 type:complete len:248 (-) Transcript_21211:338-1081(-)
MANNSIRMPSTGDTNSVRRGILNRMPPPRGIEEHITRSNLRIVDRTVLEEREGLDIVLVGPEAADNTRSSAQHANRVGQEGVIRVDKPPLLLSIYHVEHVIHCRIVERSTSAFFANKELFVAYFHRQVVLQSLILKQITNSRVFIEKLFRVMQVDGRIFHIFQLARITIQFFLRQVHVFFAILLQDILPCKSFGQVTVFHETSENNWMRNLDKQVIKFFRGAILPVILRNWYFSLSFSVAFSFKLSF